MDEDTEDVGHGRDGALAALNEVVADRDIVRRFGAPADAFEAEDYKQLIALAWRHQFDEDRSKFKRELREMQEHLGPRILDRLEAPE